MAWLIVVLAGLLETGFALALKASDGFSRVVPTTVFIACAAGSFGLLSYALRTLPVGSAYAVWTGIGATGTAVVGMVALGESVTPVRIGSVVLVVAGVVGLSLSGGGAH